jgi:hypothetical protein
MGTNRCYMKKIVLFLAIFTLISGCSTKYEMTDMGQQTAKLIKGGKTYVALPADGDFAGKIQTSSGFSVAEAAAGAIIHYTDPIIAKATENVDNALESAYHYGCIYMYFIVINNWEPRRAFLSGYPTKVSLDINIYDVKSKASVIHKRLEVTGRSMTIRSQRPEDLVYSLLLEYADTLYN